MRPSDRKYTKSHEWCKVEDGVARIGITDYAVEHLSDLVYLELPTAGSNVQLGESFGEVESVKAVSDIYSPATGKVVAVNEALPDELDTLKTDPFGAGWMIRVQATELSRELMDAAAYEKHLESEA
jgi:glycine cleavage system H protein